MDKLQHFPPSRAASPLSRDHEGGRLGHTCDRPGTSLAALAGGCLLALLGGLGPIASIADDIPVFTTPPSADELADILFPPRTRSIVIDDEVQAGDAGTSAALSSADAGESGDAQADEQEGVPDENAFGLLVNFEFGKATVTEESLPYLDSVGEMLKLERAGKQAVFVEGHTDAIGSDAFNQRLSEQRALAVRRYLVSVHGIDERRLYPLGKGESELYEPNEPNAAINRRVEFRLLKRSGDGD